MSLTVMASGTLTADPQQRTGGTGKAFALCHVRVPSEDAEAMLVSAIVFGETAVRTLMACTKGDSICIGGRGALKSWTAKDGTERTGLNITATQVMTHYELGKRRKAGAGDDQSDSRRAA